MGDRGDVFTCEAPGCGLGYEARSLGEAARIHDEDSDNKDHAFMDDQGRVVGEDPGYDADEHTEQIRQLSIELAARQHDLLAIHGWATEALGILDAAVPQPPPEGSTAEKMLNLIDEIINAADPDGWADGTADEAARSWTPETAWTTEPVPDAIKRKDPS